VLRGPQGTLYGAGSMGGTIKLVPNAPNPNEFEVSGQLILEAPTAATAQIAPRTAWSTCRWSTAHALRLVASLNHTTGWIDRIVIAQPDFPAPSLTGVRGNVAAAPIAQKFHDVNDENSRTVRASLLWTPTDRLSIEPSFMYQEITQGGLNLIDSIRNAHELSAFPTRRSRSRTGSTSPASTASITSMPSTCLRRPRIGCVTRTCAKTERGGRDRVTYNPRIPPISPTSDLRQWALRSRNRRKLPDLARG